MDVETVLRDISSNILPLDSEDEEINRLYAKGASLSKEIAGELVPRLKNLKDDKIIDIILFIEQLNYQLNKEYKEEVSRGIEAGIYLRGAPK